MPDGGHGRWTDLLQELEERVPQGVRWQRVGSGDRLELLGTPESLRACRAALHHAGYAALDDWFLRVDGSGALVARVVDPRHWGLPAAELQALTGGAAVGELETAWVLLLAAQRLAVGGAAGGDVTVGAVRHAARDEAAWAAARRRARAWGLDQGLNVLQRAVHGGTVTRHDRTSALLELSRARPPEALAPLREDGRLPQAGRRGRGALIALSGLDGAGKSTQAVALRDLLIATGHEAVIEWSRLATSPALDVLAAPVKRLLLRPAGPAQERSDPDHPSAPRIRRDEGVVGQVWALVVAVTDAAGHRRRTRAHLVAGRTVIRDRYTLDSLVQLRYVYGGGAPLALHARLMRVLAPTPDAAFLLELRGRDAHGRKQEQWSAEQLQDQADLYHDSGLGLGVTLVDARRPRQDVAETLARAVLKDLGPSPARRRGLGRRTGEGGGAPERRQR